MPRERFEPTTPVLERAATVNGDAVWEYYVSNIQHSRSQWPRGLAWTVFGRSNAGIVDSYPTQGIDVRIVWVYSVIVLFVCR
jgi:hypothetical protein